MAFFPAFCRESLAAKSRLSSGFRKPKALESYPHLDPAFLPEDSYGMDQPLGNAEIDPPAIPAACTSFICHSSQHKSGRL